MSETESQDDDTDYEMRGGVNPIHDWPVTHDEIVAAWDAIDGAMEVLEFRREALALRLGALRFPDLKYNDMVAVMGQPPRPFQVARGRYNSGTELIAYEIVTRGDGPYSMIQYDKCDPESVVKVIE